jgi:beta-lactamase superfamily II metal-dependent hydrolase
MSGKFYKFLIISGALILAALFIIFLFFYNPSHNLEVYFLDVGQGDAMLIKSPFGQNILIDGGPDRSVIRKLTATLPSWDRQIDLMILTHPHDDHVTGLVEVLKRLEVKKIIYTGAVHAGPNYLAWLKEIKAKNIPLLVTDGPQDIILGQGLCLKIIYPLKSFINQETENLNNASIAVKIIYGKTNFLFAADLEKEAEEELIKSSIDLRSNVLKVGHHGSDTGSTEKFLKAVRPEIAVIEVGKNNKFNLPSRRVIKRLERIGAKIYQTDKHGDIKIISNGKKIYGY